MAQDTRGLKGETYSICRDNTGSSSFAQILTSSSLLPPCTTAKNFCAERSSDVCDSVTNALLALLSRSGSYLKKRCFVCGLMFVRHSLKIAQISKFSDAGLISDHKLVFAPLGDET